MSYYFSMEIIAPDGLSNLSQRMHTCIMELTVHPSRKNGKILLIATPDALFKWSMDFINETKISAAGEFYHYLNEAKEKLTSLSTLLINAQYPHRILLDDETRSLTKTYQYLWESKDNH